MPLRRDVGTNIKELKKVHPDWSNKRLLAASLSGARQAGKIKVKPAKKKGR